MCCIRFLLFAFSSKKFDWWKTKLYENRTSLWCLKEAMPTYFYWKVLPIDLSLNCSIESYPDVDHPANGQPSFEDVITISCEHKHRTWISQKKIITWKWDHFIIDLHREFLRSTNFESHRWCLLCRILTTHRSPWLLEKLSQQTSALVNEQNRIQFSTKEIWME